VIRRQRRIACVYSRACRSLGNLRRLIGLPTCGSRGTSCRQKPRRMLNTWPWPPRLVVDYLLTWNCKHIANADLLPALYETLRAEGFPPPLIVTPEEFSDAG
jgi:hypothetical protein